MDTTTADPPNTLIPPSKQTRIDIWRTEVAALTAPFPTSTPTSPSSPTAAASSSSSSAASMLSPQRRGSLWRRVARRIAGKGSGKRGIHDKEDVWDEGVRTDMYKVIPEVGTAGQEEADGNKDEIALGEESSDSDDERRGLKEKQERLERAAKLLNQGAARNGERP